MLAPAGCRSEVRENSCVERSGIAPGEEVYGSVDVGCITDMTYFEFKIKQLLASIKSDGKCRTTMYVVDDSTSF